MRLSGGQVVAEALVRAGAPYAVGIPGHGCLQLTEALRERSDAIRVIQPLHETGATHLADGYYRASGQPLAVFTSIGPGALNTAIGLATAYVDSTAVLVLTGETHVHMSGVGVLQEVERRADAGNWRALEPLCKRHFLAVQPRQLPRIMARAFNQMLSGRPGPVVVGLPMDVQASAADVEIGDLALRRPATSAWPDPDAIEKAADLLHGAKRPVILVGGGVRSARAYAELQRVAEAAGAAVVNTMMGLGSFPADHPLYGWATGSKGTSCGLHLTRSSDVLLAVGCRFADETTCSYRRGSAFDMAGTKLIHIDVDPHEIGKNYPAEVGVVSDARTALTALAEALEAHGARDWKGSEYTAEIATLRGEWEETLAAQRDDAREPMMISTLLRALRATLPRDATIVHSSGNTQAQMIQEFPFYEPGACITTGGFSTMGFTLPASMGVKLALPGKTVVGITGDGDFLMHIQELSTAVRYDIPVVWVVANNEGWIAISDLQAAVFGDERTYATDFEHAGKPCTPCIADLARDFGCWSTRITRGDQVAGALRDALASGRPAVIEAMVCRERPYTGTPAVGWWDVPIPEHMEGRAEYERGLAEEDV